MHFQRKLFSTLSSISPPRAKVIEERDEAMALVEKKAGIQFRIDAGAFVLRYLGVHGATSGEDITDACKAAGIVPHNDRAFGPVFMALSRKNFIEKCGTAARRKGHGTSGATIWRLYEQGDE